MENKPKTLIVRRVWFPVAPFAEAQQFRPHYVVETLISNPREKRAYRLTYVFGYPVVYTETVTEKL